MIPVKIEKYNVSTGKQYQHVYTKEEQEMLLTAQLKGKTTKQVMKEIVSSLKDEDWSEV